MVNNLKFKNENALLKQLAYVFLVENSTSKSIQIASSVYDQDFDVSEEVESLLVQLWSTKEEKFIYLLFKNALISHQFEHDVHIYVVAMLFKFRQISLGEVAKFLDFEVGSKYSDLDEYMRKLIDVSWLVNEDIKDNVMQPHDDGLLEEALLLVANNSNFKLNVD